MKNTVPCLLCGTELSPTFDDISDNDIAVNMSWQGGDVAVMHCGYGSRHDLTNFVIAMCDNCLEKSLRDGRIAILNYE